MNENTTEILWINLKKVFAKQKLFMLQSGQLTLNGRTMKFHFHKKGPQPADGYPLIFGFHGGGNCPANINDSQYNNHKGLYNKQLPNSCIWFTPRSIENASDMWWKDYIEDFFFEIVRSFVLNDLVNVNKVFITGYSAGGDGVYHMASRLADHLAGAAMMAGHPNEANFTNLRNIKFSIQVGGLDKAYNRANEGIKCSRMIAQLAQNYGGYKNSCRVIENKPHWMNKQDAQIFNWLFSASRNPYPDTILFKQCSRRRKQFFYYLRIGETINGRDNQETLVLKEGNTFRIFSNRKLAILVNSKFINPNQTICIIHNGQTTVERMFVRNEETMKKTMLERIDPDYIFQDQFYSVPFGVIDITSAICSQFRISLAEKNAEYEPGLPKNPEQTPHNFLKIVYPLLKRSSGLPKRFIEDYRENYDQKKENWGSFNSLDQWGNQLNEQSNNQKIQNLNSQNQLQTEWSDHQGQGNQQLGNRWNEQSFQQITPSHNQFQYTPPYLHNRNLQQQNTQQVPYNPYNQYAPKQNDNKKNDCHIF